MNTEFLVKFPVTRDLGPCTFIVRDMGMETKEDNALWHYNKSREHDGLRPVDELPKGTTFLPVVSPSPKLAAGSQPKVSHNITVRPGHPLG